MSEHQDIEKLGCWEGYRVKGVGRRRRRGQVLEYETLETWVFAEGKLGQIVVEIRSAGREEANEVRDQFRGLLDAKYERLSAQEVMARVRVIRPDVVGLTAFTNEIKQAAAIAASAKAFSLPRLMSPADVQYSGKPYASQ